ncbi:hypothetical protein BDZ91DRAFT_712568 [Kalaharituber pfeilii]|nr:hypothetical protein BDZ91DRAFT_712568 [Kalaharituber pfeilii]
MIMRRGRCYLHDKYFLSTSNIMCFRPITPSTESSCATRSSRMPIAARQSLMMHNVQLAY